MIKGGYRIIDFKDTPLVIEGATMMIEGIYESVEGNYRKPLLLSGLVINGVEKPDVFAMPLVVGDVIAFMGIYGANISIQNTDAVYLTPAA